MQIKIIDGFVREYEDVAIGKVYDVVDEYPEHYVIEDDQFDWNIIPKVRCEIITEGDMFKKGDRVKIVVEDASDTRTLEEWFLQGKENKVGEIDEINPDGAQCHSVNFGDGLGWYVPVELLQKIPEPECDTTEEGQQTLTLQQIIRFTQRNKGFNVSIEDGNITLADWSNDPNATFYRPKTIEEMLELMELIKKINEYKFDNE